MFLINLIKGALQRELDQVDQVLSPGDVAERVVTKSAFCAARQKLNPTAFIELNRHLIQRWYHDAAVQRWRGFDLRAIDGAPARHARGDRPVRPDVSRDPATLARISQVD